MRSSIIGSGVLLGFLGVMCTTAPDSRTATPEYFTLPDRAALDLPYSDAVQIGDLLFLAGTLGTLPGTRTLIEGGIQAETRQALENVRSNLERHGSSLDRTVKCTVFLADIAEFDAMNSVYAQYFRANRPARTTIGVAGLPRGARVEIECVATLNPQRR
jgi:reactive intermediate/imine deaminase